MLTRIAEVCTQPYTRRQVTPVRDPKTLRPAAAPPREAKKNAPVLAGSAQVRLVPAEHVSLFLVELPLRSKAQRLAAAGFAVEDLLASPLDETHIAVGPRFGRDRYLVAAVAHGHMPPGLDRAIVPEQMALPVPAQAQGLAQWNIWRAGDRAVVRSSDGTGFGLSITYLSAIWEAFGKPPLHSFGAPLPRGFSPASQSDTPPQTARRDLAFDLRQGRYSQSPSILRRSLFAAALIVVAAVGAQSGLAYRDVLQLEAKVQTASQALTPRLAKAAPGLVPTSQAIPALERMIARTAAPQGDPFLSVMAKTSQGMRALAGQMNLSTLDYSAVGPQLTLRVQTESIDNLRAAADRLKDAGLQVETGTISAGDAGAQTTFTVKER